MRIDRLPVREPLFGIVHEPGGARGSRFELPDAPPVIGQAFLAGVAVILFGRIPA
jgi:hypothetical protein